MTCRRCGTEYQTIICPACAERASRAAMMRAQPPHLARAASGQCDLVLVHKQQHKPHVQLFGDANRAFCGEPLAVGRRNHMAYAKLPPDSICVQCARIIADLMQTPAEAT